LIIVDASVAVQWIAEEDTSALSDELLSRSDLTAPELMQIEVANALRRKIWVGDMSLDHAKAGLQFIRDKVAILRVPSDLLDRALEMSHDMYHPVYDCIYLSLAEKHDAPVVTYDRDFIDRAREHGYQKLVITLPLAAP
jgi:predicted nucleic acid-binding protein